MGAVLGVSERLLVGQRLTSPNGEYQFQLQGNGDLVLSYRGSVRLWSSRTAGQEADFAGMQDDGNFVLRGPDLADLWSSRTGDRGPSFLQVQDDGNVVIYTAPPLPRVDTWSTRTALRYRIEITENGGIDGPNPLKNESGIGSSIAVGGLELDFPPEHVIGIGPIHPGTIKGTVYAIRNCDPATKVQTGSLCIIDDATTLESMRYSLTKNGDVSPQ